MSALRFSVPLAVASLGLLGLAGAALGAAAPPKVDFARDVQPLLKAKCQACHGANQAQGGLRLNLPADAFRGGDSGAVIKPGHAAESLLIHLVSGADPKRVMPPAGPRLTSAQVKLLRDWIDQGASWDGAGGRGPGVGGKGTAGAGAATHWAFQPVKRPAAPKVKNSKWVRNPIDAFVLARLEKEKIAPSAGADRPTLIRRLSLDLLGLPPTAAEVAAFVNDGSPDAYEKVVDRLLASPHFGERWGRHWLDLARYADSDGYEKDLARPYAYLYRDWVIDALNRDMPFDQFTIDQLAGDLVDGSMGQRGNEATTGRDAVGVLSALDEKQRRLIATGFHRNTLKNREGGVDQEEDRVKATVDRANTTGAAWLGLTVGCAQCHSHKYDPITQREYYGLYAFFNTASDVDLPLSAPEQAAASPKKPAAESKAQTLAENPKPPATHVLIRGDFLRPGEEVQPHVPAVLPALDVSRAPTRLDLARWLVDPANPLTSRVTVNRVWQHLFGRGLVGTPDDFGIRGEKPTHPELLDWLASEFVRQPVNGSMGPVSNRTVVDPLTHSPIDLPGGGWSLKSLVRLVVTSATYRQSSRARPELEERDPLNLLLARQNRFRPEAEVVRDLYLAASGLLSPKIGGPSIRPPLPGDIAALGYAGSVKWQETTGPDRYARGMYIFFQRTVPYPQLVEFDAPDGNNTCTRRERSNTPLQALTLLNDPVFVECAQALGLTLLRAPSGSVESRVRLAFRTCVSREPTALETQRLVRLHDEMLRLCKADLASAVKLAGKTLPAGSDPAEAAAWITVARTMLNLDEFITRE